MMKRKSAIAGMVLSALAAIYSLLGVMMAYWLAAVPGNSPEHVRLNFLVWVPATVAFLVMLAYSLAPSQKGVSDGGRIAHPDDCNSLIRFREMLACSIPTP
jgi:hypothetical protein